MRWGEENAVVDVDTKYNIRSYIFVLITLYRYMYNAYRICLYIYTSFPRLFEYFSFVFKCEYMRRVKI